MRRCWSGWWARRPSSVPATTPSTVRCGRRTWSVGRHPCGGGGPGHRPGPVLRVGRAEALTTGRLSGFAATCTCPVGVNCKHAVALVLADDPDGGPRPAPAERSGQGPPGGEPGPTARPPEEPRATAAGRRPGGRLGAPTPGGARRRRHSAGRGRAGRHRTPVRGRRGDRSHDTYGPRPRPGPSPPGILIRPVIPGGTATGSGRGSRGGASTSRPTGGPGAAGPPGGSCCSRSSWPSATCPGGSRPTAAATRWSGWRRSTAAASGTSCARRATCGCHCSRPGRPARP